MKTLSKKFKLYLIISFTAILQIIYGTQIAEAAPSAQGVSGNIDHSNEYEVLRQLWPVMKQAKMAGRIYYSAPCQTDENYPPPFPKLSVQSPTKGAYGLDAIREILGDNKRIIIANKSSGVVGIDIDNENKEILQTKISSVIFDPVDQYNASLAISAIENSRDVRTAMQKLDVHPSSRVSNQIIVMPANGLPHLEDRLKNVTMDQALDEIAKTFGGIVLYRICTNSDRYTIDFVGGTGFDVSKLH